MDKTYTTHETTGKMGREWARGQNTLYDAWEISAQSHQYFHLTWGCIDFLCNQKLSQDTIFYLFIHKSEKDLSSVL